MDRGQREWSQETNSNRLIVGLLNNMPDAALESTERQFRELLDAPSAETPVHLRLFSLPDVPRGKTARRHMNEAYAKIDELWDARLDALIVTGNEPQAACLKDEPYWGSLTRVVEWAQENTVSTVWSCLAAHAAVHHMDGVVRDPLMQKTCGVFDCIGVSPHPLIAGVRLPIRIAHSRCNDLREEALTACNYKILTRSPEAGVDTFVKEGKNSLYSFRAIRNTTVGPCRGNTAATSDVFYAANARPIRQCREDISIQPRPMRLQDTKSAPCASRTKACSSTSHFHSWKAG